MEVLFATSNRHKVSEANRIGRKFGVKFRRVDVPYSEIRNNSVSKVALAGIKYVYPKVKKPVVVEDSGLFINALNGFPGPYSRYVFDTIGVQGILDLMRGRKERSAFFVSSIGFSDGKCEKVFEGVVNGKISNSSRGSSGFGFDPIFIPKGFNKTFAEDSLIKKRISHRSVAVELFCRWLTVR
ncbi:MAG: XTP/dITP diphosphatase [Candidatus Altiarchaeota archaeon]